jgi:peroxiredoxin Q/BCP
MKEGEKAPDFSLQNQDGKTVSLKDYKGKWLVLYFYPKDNTPGCTIEAIDFTQNFSEFKKLGAVVVGISRDTPKTHCGFIEKKKLTIELLSDPEHKLMDAFGVWRPKKFMGREFLGTIRSTFIIDPKGIIRAVWDPVSVKGHAKEVLAKLSALA